MPACQQYMQKFPKKFSIAEGIFIQQFMEKLAGTFQLTFFAEIVFIHLDEQRSRKARAVEPFQELGKIENAFPGQTDPSLSVHVGNVHVR